MTAYRLHTLGPLRLESASEAAPYALRRQERILLAYLARRADVGVRRAELAALLWGKREEASARRVLRQALYALRRLLREALEVDEAMVRLRHGVIELDLQCIEDDIRAGRAAAALARVDGEFLEGLEDAGDEPLRLWIMAERSGVAALLAHALDAMASAARATGRWDEVQPLARRAAEANPWDETSQARLIEVLRDAGRVHEAAAWHARAVTRMRAELDDEPSAAFLALRHGL